MIDIVERYKWVTSQEQFFGHRIVEWFKLYLQLATAIAGGFLFLRTQPGAANTLLLMRVVASFLLMFIATCIVFLISFDMVAWWGYRQAESDLGGQRVPPPSASRVLRQEPVMILLIIISMFLGVVVFLVS